MYAQHFGLEREPFSIAPDPRYLYISERHREALAHLRYGLNGGGIVLLTGEIGAGKTTLCRSFLDQLPAGCIVAYIFNPRVTVRELLATICDELAVTPVHPPGGIPSLKTFIDPLNRFLLEAHANGSMCLLVIDEAQALSTHVLEQLRLLTNLETTQRKLLQIVLVGQPELRSRLEDPALKQLAQRVIARYHLGPLVGDDIGRYVEHRLLVAGLRTRSPFPPDLLPMIETLTGGIPRRINRLCDRALLGAYAQRRAVVDRATLLQAAREVGEVVPAVPARRVAAWTSGALAGLAVLGVAAAMWLGQNAPAPPADPPREAAMPAAATDAAQAVAVAASRSAAVRAAASAGAQSAASLVGPMLTALDLRQRLRRQPLDEQRAWRELARSWQAVDLGTADACRAAAAVGLGCFNSRGGIALIRQLDRPAILLLDDPRGARLLLEGLDAETAFLRVAGRTYRLPLIELAGLWSGEFATLWRVPEPLLRSVPPDGGEPLAAWIDQRLGGTSRSSAASPPTRIDAALRQRLTDFQRAQGLAPDGVPGPVTLMTLNRLSGVAEPRLAKGR